MKKLLLSQFLVLLFTGVLLAVPQARSGELDLRGYNYSYGPLELGGEWKVFPNEILSLYEIRHFDRKYCYADFTTGWDEIDGFDFYSNYEFGSATYYLKIIAPDRNPPLALKVKEINTAHRLLLNGVEERQVGRIGKSASSSKPGWEEYVKPINLRPGVNHLVLQVSNYQHHAGGNFPPITLGREGEIMLKEDLRIGAYLFIAGCLFVSAIFALGLFWFRSGARSVLFFAIFSLFYGFYILHFDHDTLYILFKNVSWETGMRLEVLALAITILAYIGFMRYNLEEILRPFFYTVPAGIAALTAILTLLLPIPAVTVLHEYFTLFIGFWYVITLILAAPSADFSHKLTWVNVIGALGILLVFVNRTLSSYNFITDNLLIDVLGNLIFIFSQVVANAIRFGRSYRETAIAALAASRTRDEFLNTISHEFKTPMNAILGMATFLENSNLEKHQREKLQSIKRNGEVLMSLINDVLSISEIEKQNFVLREEPLSIRECVNSALKLARPHLKSEHVNVLIHIDDDLPDKVMGDQSRLKQVLLHLFTNAFKFTEYGEVTLRINRLKPLSNLENISFEISDTGVGISKSQQKKLFGKFRQGLTGNDRSYQGLGIGLRVVSELVDLMGGKIELESSKGFGTLVRFNLLFGDAPAESKRLSRVYRKTEVDKTLKVLYAEDNPVNQKLLQMMLKNLGLEIDLANDGREAVSMAAKTSYNIIFMDIQMPRMDGIEATRKILEKNGSRPIIIAITANMAEVDKERCFEVGMNDFMTKPVKQENLKLAILKWQGLKKYLDDANGEFIKLSS